MAKWADLCVAGTVSPVSTRFRYYVTPNAGGPLVERLHNAKEKATIEQLLKEIASTKIMETRVRRALAVFRRFLAAGEDSAAPSSPRLNSSSSSSPRYYPENSQLRAAARGVGRLR